MANETKEGNMMPNASEDDFCSTCAVDIKQGEGVQFPTFHGLGFPIVLCAGCVGDAAKVLVKRPRKRKGK